jgi:hypothetical protein
MFFRREKPRVLSFDDRLENLRQFGFSYTKQPGDKARIIRSGYGAIVEHLPGGKLQIGKAGLMIGGDIAMLVNGGYQMFFRTASGKDVPALAEHLTALHAFDEDLREALGMTSLYNLSLGTTSEEHLYDRVEDRDHHARVRPWEKKSPART